MHNNNTSDFFGFLLLAAGQSRSASLTFLVLGDLSGTTDKTSSSGGDETDLKYKNINF